MEEFIISVNNKDYTIKTIEGEFSNLIVGDKLYKIELIKKLNDDVYSFLVNQKVYQVEFDYDNKNLDILLNGFTYSIEIKDSTYHLLQKFLNNSTKNKISGAGIVKAPMPGLIVKVFVHPGMNVIEGDKLLIMEAMKMENILKSTISGIVKEVRVIEGNTVEKDNILIVIEP
jgi:biotin carboxyl carrier protein